MDKVDFLEGLLNPTKKRKYEKWLMDEVMKKKEIADHLSDNNGSAEEIAEAYRLTWRALDRLNDYWSKG